MTELIALADKSGWFIVIVILAAWKFIPAIADKIAPDYMAARREDDAAKRASAQSITDRVITVIENNSHVMTAVSMSVGGVQRALDANTQQLSRITDSVERGPECPLPGCPFMNKDANG